MIATLVVALLVVTALAVWGWTLAWRRRPRVLPLPQPYTVPGHYLITWKSEFGDVLVYDGYDSRAARIEWTAAEPWRTLGVPRGGRMEFWDGQARRGVRELAS